jgi:hypothetical protein
MNRWVVLRFGGVAAVGAGLVVATACSRSANQNNFLGKPCQAAADCPAPLLCVQSACWEPCNANGTCPNPGESCILGACVPGGSAGGGDGGMGNDSGSHDPGSSSGGMIQSDGTGVVTLPGMQMPQSFAVDGAYAFVAYPKAGAFGATTFVVSRFALDGSNAETSVATLNTMDPAKPHVAASNGKVFWVDSPSGMASNFTLYTRPADLSSAATSISPVSVPANSFGTGLIVDGSSLVFVDGSFQVRVYDAQTGTLDATVYGTTGMAGNGPSFAKNGSELYWLQNPGGPGPGNQLIFTATLGSAGAQAAGSGIPSNAMLMGVGGSGTNFFAFTRGSTPGQTSLNTVDTTTGTTGMSSLNGAQIGNPTSYAIVGSSLYVVDSVQGPMGYESVVARVDLTNPASPTTTGTLRTTATQLMVSGSNVYALESLGTGTGGAMNGYRIARFPLP